MVRRSPLDVNPTDLRKGSFLQELITNKLRPESRGRGVKGIEELTKEIAPRLSGSPSNERDLRRPSPMQQLGDARKLSNEGIDFRKIGAEIAELAQAEAEAATGENSQIANMAKDMTPLTQQEMPSQEIDWNAISEGLSGIERPPEETKTPGLWDQLKESYNEHFKDIDTKYPPNKSQSPSFFSDESPYMQTAPEWIKDLRDYMTSDKAGVTGSIKDALTQIGEDRLPEQEDLEITPPPASKPQAGLFTGEEDTRPNLLAGATSRSFARPQAGVSEGVGSLEDFKEQPPKTGVGSFPKEEQETLPPAGVGKISAEELRQIPPENLQPQPGAVQAIKQNPQIQSEIQRLTGGVIPKELLDKASDYEKALTDTTSAVDDNIAEIRKRIDENKLTTQDTILLGIAVLAPALIAAATGGSLEEILSPFAPASEALLGIQKERAKNERDDLDRISELELKKAELAEKGAKYKQDLLDKVPGRKLKERLGSREIKQFGNAVGIETGNPDLWINANKIHSEKDLDNMLDKVLPDAEEALGNVQNTNQTLEEVLNIIDSVGDQGFWDQALATMGGKLGAPTVMVMGSDGKPREVNALAEIETRMTKLNDFYNKDMGNRALTKNVVDHWSNLIRNPFDRTGLYKTDLQTMRNQILTLKDMTNQGFINKFSSRGILKDPLMQQLELRDVKFAPTQATQLKRQEKEDAAMWANQDINQLRKKVD